MKNNPNHLAFPGNQATKDNRGFDNGVIYHQGLTKREYFAALAMQGILASDDTITFDQVTECAVKHADKLIEELNK